MALAQLLAKQETAISDARIAQLSECKFLSEPEVVELAAKCKVRLDESEWRPAGGEECRTVCACWSRRVFCTGSRPGRHAPPLQVLAW